MKTITTYINPSVYLAMKETAESEWTKLWRFIEEGIRLRIADYQRRKRAGESSNGQETFSQVK